MTTATRTTKGETMTLTQLINYQKDGFVPGVSSVALSIANEGKRNAKLATPETERQHFRGGIRFRQADDPTPAGYYWYWILR